MGKPVAEEPRESRLELEFDVVISGIDFRGLETVIDLAARGFDAVDFTRSMLIGEYGATRRPRGVRVDIDFKWLYVKVADLD